MIKKQEKRLFNKNRRQPTKTGDFLNQKKNKIKNKKGE